MHTIKNLLTVFFLGLFTQHVVAQATTVDTLPYAMEYHLARLETFKKEHMEKGQIVFIGNSITQFGDWKQLLKDSSIINRGIAGDVTYGVLGRLEDIVASQPSKLFIEIGINDISKNISEDIIGHNIILIVQKVKQGSPSTEVYVHSILPTNDAVKESYPDAYNKNSHVRNLNNYLMRNAPGNGYVFVDVYKIFSDKDGNLDAQYAKKDGIHLNAQGYLLWVSALKQQGVL